MKLFRFVLFAAVLLCLPSLAQELRNERHILAQERTLSKSDSVHQLQRGSGNRVRVFVDTRALDEKGKLIVYDANDNIEDELQAGVEPQWTAPVSGDSRLVIQTNSDSASVTIKEEMIEAYSLSSQAAVGKWDARPLKPNASFGQIATTIVLIRYLDDGEESYTCTGVLVRYDLVMSAAHCLCEDQGVMTSSVVIEFDFLQSTESLTRTPPVKLRGESTCSQQPNSGVDAAIATLAKKVDRQVLKWSLEKSYSLFFFHHPNGKPMELEIACGIERYQTDESMLHSCDSDGGSSGAPLIDQLSGRIVGLHYRRYDDDVNLDPSLRFNWAIPIAKLRPIVDNFPGLWEQLVGLGSERR